MPTCGADILVHRKVNSAETFSRSWNEFKNGFGNLGWGNYWIGNDQLHYLTASVGYTKLRVVMTASDGRAYVNKFSTFYY